MPWKPIVARFFTPTEFDAYVRSLEWDTWVPKGIVVHNTAAPSLAQRPDGLTLQHIRNLEKFYRDERSWSAGPHLFLDDKGAWVFTPLTTPGVHSPSFNATHLGLEMLGDFDTESFTTGRGAKVRANTIAALASLHRRLNLSPNTIRLHREDPKTTHACPGKLVTKAPLIAAVKEAMTMQEAPPPGETEGQKWAREMGLSDATRPTEPATRAELWEMLRRYHAKTTQP